MGEVLPFAPVIRLFACGKVFTFRLLYHPYTHTCFFQVENPVEKVQNSSVQACFRVEFHTFHKVFHNLISTGSEPTVHFVIFKSEL